MCVLELPESVLEVIVDEVLMVFDEFLKNFDVLLSLKIICNDE